MKSMWKNLTIEQLCKIVTSGGTPKSNCDEYYKKGTIPWLNTKEVDFKRIYSTEKYITEKGLNNSSAKWVDKNSIVVAMYGATAGKVGLIKIPLTTNQACCNLTINECIADYNFVYYYLYNNYDLLSSMANGGAQQNLNSLQIKNFIISLPPIETQRKIAKVLSDIDDKIELNNKINENLEQQAQAIFKSWFIDFEPFGGKMPKDWKKTTLDQFCKIFTGKKNANEFDNDGSNKFFTCSPNPLKINSYIYDGDAIIISGNGAFTGRTYFYSGKFDLYQRTYACTMLSNTKLDYIFLLYIFIKNVLQQNIMGGTHGSAIPYIVMNDIAKFEFYFNEKIFDELSEIMKSIVNHIFCNEQENEKLSNLRDTLLPKLMSGELDVENVDIKI